MGEIAPDERSLFISVSKRESLPLEGVVMIGLGWYGVESNCIL